MTDQKKIDAILEPYRIALKLEIEGKELFEKAARTTKSVLAKKTFVFLAKEELQHIKQIERYFHRLEKSGGTDFADMEKSNADEKLEQFNKKLETLKDEYKSTETDIEAYQLALKFESGAEEFYVEMYDKATHPNEKKFYAWLIEEESMHSRLINSCLKFVDDPIGWFQKRKS